ncbi:MAG: nucleotide pyrophosphohydrolase [Chlamydiae bacterium CG10_big_fil_rev_8_21_14_0_10_42_34]|nr:MAG: nucleotide pyrophosphohydrolase [Chlamydiae bacterium CG10_big_fil_rev_8_21_14_0_10_42_34]
MHEIQVKHREFTKKRNWEQFHSPKNLAAALSVEASELLEIFMWLKSDQPLTPTQLQNVRDEMGDIYLYLLRLADVLNIDLLEATREKFAKVEEKYTLEKSLELTRSLTHT